MTALELSGAALWGLLGMVCYQLAIKPVAVSFARAVSLLRWRLADMRAQGETHAIALKVRLQFVARNTIYFWGARNADISCFTESGSWWKGVGDWIVNSPKDDA